MKLQEDNGMHTRGPNVKYQFSERKKTARVVGRFYSCTIFKGTDMNCLFQSNRRLRFLSHV